VDRAYGAMALQEVQQDNRIEPARKGYRNPLSGKRSGKPLSARPLP
jgi:hypothetical protein